jgi:hypothetical protein
MASDARQVRAARVRRALAGVVVLALVPAPSSGAAAATSPRCTALAVSPDFRRDRSVLCLRLVISPARDVEVWASKDGGRTWQRTAGAGLAFDAVAETDPVPVFSPRYADDRSVYVMTGKGLHVSTDLGATFTLVDALADGGGHGSLVPFVVTDPAPLGVVPATRTQLVHAHLGHGAAVVDPALRLHRPVAGSASGSARFLLPSGFPAAGEAFSLTSDDDVTASRPREVPGWDVCDPTLTCTRRFTFPADNAFESAWLAPDVARSGGAYAVLRAFGAGVSAWRSDDSGRTFTRWKSVDGLVAQAARYDGRPQLSFAVSAGAPKRIYLQVARSNTQGPRRRTVRDSRVMLYRSDDRGTTWRLVSFTPGDEMPGPRGTVPWDDNARLYVAPDGRLFALGPDPASDGAGAKVTFCSTDEGRTWHRACAR